MKVNTNELLRQSEQFLDAMNRMMEFRDTVLKVDRNLSRERTGERFHEPLKAAADQIERQARDLRNLQKALEQIAEAYSSCETRIVDRTEQSGSGSLLDYIGELRIPDHFFYTVFGTGEAAWNTGTSGGAAENSITSAIDWTPWDPETGGNG